MRLHMILSVLALAATPAMAHKELTVHYPVKGNTAGEIQDYIKANGPVVGRSVPYAFTMIATKTNKRTEKTGDTCRYRRYQTSMVFTYVLPRLDGGQGLPKATLANWKKFTQDLKVHETLHKDNWSQCLAEHDKAAAAVKAGDCDKLEKKVEKLLSTKKLACLRNDMKIDDVFGRQLWKDPFVKEAMSQSKTKGRNVFGLLGRKTVPAPAKPAN